MHIGVLTLDKAGCIRTFNSAAELLLGYCGSDVRGQPGEQILPGVVHALACPSGQRHAGRGELQLKINARHKDGREVPLLATAYSTAGNDHPAAETSDIVLVFQSAAESEKLENQLRHVNRLQSLDQFAAGVVHELRNPLTGISTTAQNMMENIRPGDRFHEEVQDILADVKSIEDIVRRVLDFAHPSKSQVREGPIEDIVEDVLRFSKAPLRRQGIRLTTSLNKSSVKVRVDVSQMKQVFFNIIRNACEAMPQGGELRVSTTRQKAAAGRGLVRVAVADTGPGIAHEYLERIFEPFFTLHHEGTGLGLAISRKIVENHGGRIEVKSQPGTGTEFGIVLPVC